METQQVLEQSGLNNKQADVYLALLELGTASVQAIAQKAGIKRPTTYLILDELEQKRLVSIVPQKKALYTVEPPEYLLTDLNKKREQLQSVLPSLNALYNDKKEKPQVQLFPGKEGLKKAYDKVFAVNEVSFFGTIQDVIAAYPEGLEIFYQKIKQDKLRVRELFARSPKDMEYAKNAPKGDNYSIRFVGPNMALTTDCALFGDSVAFFSYRPQIFAVMIKSREVAESLKTLYELAWQSAEPA